ncbi:unknown [Choristoneura occidentalis granulovirus]|uniref:Uncharacterized protein n=1 Tax=Choristoneura occidentalis granulovirus TaxID=364745 RepID=Q1A4L8_9BBAC|nr:unknown [Choristoneura fumiferana granulovirus]ABC61212.1 unknown [Choristoneura fumiferana granulovirus]
MISVVVIIIDDVVVHYKKSLLCETMIITLSMKRCYYFQDTHPVNILCFGRNNYYFKIKQLAACFHVCVDRKFLPNRYVVHFGDLKKKYPNSGYTLHPSTLMLHVNGLNEFAIKFCTNGQKLLLKNFIKRCFEGDNKLINDEYQFISKNNTDSLVEDIVEMECINCVYGVLSPQNIEFFSYLHKTYFKGVDVAQYLQCSPSYCINKYVDNENMVLWKDLKQYLLNKFVWSNFENRWKENTIFLKTEGVRQLFMAVVGNDDDYRNLLVEVDNYDKKQDQLYIKRKSFYKKKKLLADGCVVGKLVTSDVDFIMTTNKKIFFKLGQISRYFNLKINNYEQYIEHLIKWKWIKQSLKRTNIKWKPNMMMVDADGVFKMLKDVNLSAEADDFMYSTIYELKKFECKS